MSLGCLTVARRAKDTGRHKLKPGAEAAALEAAPAPLPAIELAPPRTAVAAAAFAAGGGTTFRTAENLFPSTRQRLPVRVRSGVSSSASLSPSLSSGPASTFRTRNCAASVASAAWSWAPDRNPDRPCPKTSAPTDCPSKEDQSNCKKQYKKEERGHILGKLANATRCRKAVERSARRQP